MSSPAPGDLLDAPLPQGESPAAVKAPGRSEPLLAGSKLLRTLDTDVIVSDIEMPEMSGYAFAEAVHSGGRWADVPMIALSSRMTEQHLERGRSAGFTSFVPKARREELFDALRQVFQQPGEAA